MSKSDTDSPLEKLLVPEELDEEFLFQFLDPYLNLNRDTGEFVFSDKFTQAGPRERVVVGLLAHIARYELGFEQHKWIEVVRLGKQVGVTHERTHQELDSLTDYGISLAGGRTVSLNYDQFQKVKTLCESIEQGTSPD